MSLKCILTEFEISTPSRFQDTLFKITIFLLLLCCHFVSIVRDFILESWLTFVAKQLILQVLNLYFVLQ